MRGRRILTAAIIAGLTLGALYGAAMLARRERRHTHDQQARLETWPVNMAHRGASFDAPENTMEAFHRAIEGGAGGLELDAHMTLDGEIVVIHDDTVDRTSDGTGFVRETTLEGLRGLDAGYRFTPDGGRTHPFRGRGARVPTLREVYEAFPGTPINVDIKEVQDGVERIVRKTIREVGGEECTIVASGHYPVIRRFRGQGVGIPTAASYREVGVFFALSLLGLEGLLDPQYQVLQVPPRHRGVPVVTSRFIAAAHALGLRVDVWTIDEADEMRRLLDLGVDTIMTNRPDVLAGILKDRR